MAREIAHVTDKLACPKKDASLLVTYLFNDIRDPRTIHDYAVALNHRVTYHREYIKKAFSTRLSSYQSVEYTEASFKEIWSEVPLFTSRQAVGIRDGDRRLLLSLFEQHIKKRVHEASQAATAATTTTQSTMDDATA
eukprot:TRINITY_DN6210_c0_g1_i1.p1 TRINITY_DN6210_c0_g1~~TRINITY_DN6210_c0_g1_i1.p1  ORF type:complete len:137 (-),score=27.81 TRINITY_DN6210_c0_g1_i1:77-487(-)